jgi:hypothetical protein
MDGVGELYADPSELARSSPAAAKNKDKPVNKNNKRSDVKAHPVTVVTDADGNFKAYVISYEEGTSTLKASAVVANITQESGDLTVDWYAPVYTFTVEPQYPADSVSPLLYGIRLSSLHVMHLTVLTGSAAAEELQGLY